MTEFLHWFVAGLGAGLGWAISTWVFGRVAR